MSSSAFPQTPQPTRRGNWFGYFIAVIVTALLTILVLGLLVSIFERKQEAQQPFVRLVEVTEESIDPSTWGVNWPRQYDSYPGPLGSDSVPARD